MWGSSSASGSRSIPIDEREDFLRSLWPAMGRAYCLAHPWEDPYSWQKILDAGVECLRAFGPRGRGAKKQALDPEVLNAAWEAATETIEAAFESITKQHSLFRARRGQRPSLEVIVEHGGVLDKAKERACRMATTGLFMAMQSTNTPKPNSVWRPHLTFLLCSTIRKWQKSSKCLWVYNQN